MIGLAKNMELGVRKEYNENLGVIRNINLIYSVIALWLHGNDWSAGHPQPYPR